MIFGIITDDQLAGFFKKKPVNYSDKLIDIVEYINDIFDAIDLNKMLGRPPSIEIHTEFQKLFDQLKKELIVYSKESNIQLKLSIAEQILHHSGSFTRGRLLVDIKPCLTHDEWIKLFFNYWSMIEIADELIDELKVIFRNEDMSKIMKKYASKADYKAYLALPDTLIVHRGCSTNSIEGLSWTTDFNKAKFFAKRRYDLFSKNSMMLIRIISDIRCPDEQQKYQNLPFEETYIAHANVNKKDCLYFNDRGENEIFCFKTDIFDTAMFEDLVDIEVYEID